MAITPSCDPATLVQQAKCYNCIPKQARDAVRAFLLCQVLNKATPPCVTPTAPVQNAVINGGGNPAFSGDLQVSWKQLSNSGTLIVGYIVSWGTTSGGPYTSNSGLLPVVPKQYLITGLTPGTTYFVVVQAIGAVAGCNSANSNERSGVPTGGGAACAAGTTFATAWANRVVANGGAAPSAATQTAIANFQCGLITDGLDTLMFSWNAFAPDSLTASLTPQLLSLVGGPGGGPAFDPWTNHGFVGADLTVNGLQGDGVAKWLDTGLSCSNEGLITTSAGMTIYNATADTSGGNNGIDNGTFSRMYLLVIKSPITYYCWDIGTSQVSVANAGWTGYTSGNRTALNANAIYQANSGVPHNTLGTNNNNTTGSVTPQQPWFIPVFAFTNNTGQSSFTNARLSFWASHKGLTSAQSALFFARIQQLRTDLGGGMV